MKGKINIGKATVEHAVNAFRKASRELELENSTGWTCTRKLHKSAKDYTRKEKHKGREIF